MCEKNNAFDCWVDADRVCVGCGSNSDGTGVPVSGSKVFIDLSGRAWVQYTRAENIFLVDINGDKGPNRFGKDRWMFTFADEYGNRICTKGTTEDNGYTCSNAGYPKKVTPLVSSDIKQKHYWCQHPTCYYKSWLID